jgi:hypothetical protein
MYVAVLAVQLMSSRFKRCHNLTLSLAACSPSLPRLNDSLQVEAVTPLTVLALARGTFLSVLGPLEELLKREKSPQVRQMLAGQGSPCCSCSHVLASVCAAASCLSMLRALQTACFRLI